MGGVYPVFSTVREKATFLFAGTREADKGNPISGRGS